MQANREMLFQKNCTKPERIGETFINAFIANAVGDGSWRISGFVNTAHHTIGNGIVFTVPLAAIRLPIESILLPVPRTVSDGAGDGAIAALIAVMGMNEAKAFGVKGITGSRLQSTRKIAAGYRNAHRNGFDSSDAEKIAECGGKMGKMVSVVGRPYVWYVRTYVEINESFSYLISDLKAIPA